MQAEIITIGDELLIGQTVDTNSAWLGAALVKLGIQVYQITSIADERTHILKALGEAQGRSQLVLITGGLGPTEDDITKATLCEFFDTTLETVPEVLADIEAFFSRIGKEMLDVNVHQAALPKAATIIRNKLGTASGMWFEREGSVFVSMPGVPYEMKGLMEGEVLERIRARFETPTIVHRTVMTQGIGESYIAARVKSWAADLSAKGMKLAYLPSSGQVRIRIGATGTDTVKLVREVEAARDALVALIPEYVYGFDGEKLWEVVGRLLRQNAATVSTAESCTGGTIAQLLTSVPGSSAYFMGGVVAYDNAVKMNMLGVAEADLVSHGAVSSPVVEQMAVGVRERMGTTYSMATSGVAGPGGGSAQKPVGTVWIAVAGPDGVFSERFQFGQNRSRNIERAALWALDLLRKRIPGGSFENP